MNSGDWYTVLPWAAALSARISRADASRRSERVNHMKRLSAEQLAEAGAAAILLVACDFDGTLADIAAHPDMARPRERAVEALRALSRTPHTHVAIVSGRSLRDLRERMRPDASWGLAGTHGAELGAPADPTEQYEAARPEWYFMFLFELLKYFPASKTFLGLNLEVWGAMILPGLMIGLIVAMPWIGNWRRPGLRPT